MSTTILIIYVYPINDFEYLTLDSTCKCTPTIKEEYGQMIVVHNSYDCREAVEEALEIIKQQVNGKDQSIEKNPNQEASN